MHTGDKPFHCHECDFRAAKKSNLDDHRRSRHGDPGSGPYACGVCGRFFSTMGRARRHIALVHEKSKAPADGNAQLHVGVGEQDVAVEFLNDLGIQHQEEAPFK